MAGMNRNRDPERIGTMIGVLKEAWEIYPDMRLGQLLCVCAKSAVISGVEDDILLAGMKQYIENMKCPQADDVGAGKNN